MAWDSNKIGEQVGHPGYVEIQDVLTARETGFYSKQAIEKWIGTNAVIGEFSVPQRIPIVCERC